LHDFSRVLEKIAGEFIPWEENYQDLRLVPGGSLRYTVVGEDGLPFLYSFSVKE
jgi:hypothetical protein